MQQPFQRFLDRHAASVWRFIAARVDRDDVDDVFQETVLSALRAWPDLDHTDNLRGWLFTVARSRVVDHHRAGGRRPVPVAEPPAPADDPPGLADAGLWRAVGALPPKQHQAVHHRFVDDLAYARIGAIMGTSEAAARQNVHRALERLRDQWQG